MGYIPNRSRTNMSPRLNISPRCWGPPTWQVLHSMAHAYPDKPSAEEQRQARNFAEALGCMLPCEKCRNHYRDLYSKLGQSLELSREDMENYYFQVHNAVNVATGKPTITRDVLGERLHDWKRGSATVTTADVVHNEGNDDGGLYWMLGFIVAMLFLSIALIYICVQSCSRGGDKPGAALVDVTDVTEGLPRGASAGG